MSTPSSSRFSIWNTPYLLLTLATCFWASNFVLGRAIPASLTPVTLSFLRWVLATILVTPFALPHLRKDFPTIRKHLPILLLLSLLGIAGSNTLAYFAVRQTTATSALLIQSAMPISILGFGLLLFGERPTMRQLIAMAFAAVGVLCVILGKPGTTGGALNMGTILAGLAMLCQSSYAALLRCKPPLHPSSFLFATFLCATLLLLPLEFFTSSGLPHLTLPNIGAITYLAIGPSLLAFFLFNRGVQLIGSAKASIFFYLMPVFGTLFATLLLGERIEAIELGGFVLVGIGFTLSNSRKKS
ncbi:DMT family transporter [Neokomagataea anthophila]|uniref:DMT family transporter n=1 Tax=Neokomagataea anthophila TaxID=2826925 RepID=A0ABS5E9L9_9PROT|nr:DMT family transporter [Neokomagataea anthophila]MBR0560569.1 DMT family transporter [Neokomagataea anthophila]